MGYNSQDFEMHPNVTAVFFTARWKQQEEDGKSETASGEWDDGNSKNGTAQRERQEWNGKKGTNNAKTGTGRMARREPQQGTARGDQQVVPLPCSGQPLGKTPCLKGFFFKIRP